MQKPLFNADNAEEYFSALCASYRDTANEIFKRDNDGRHASEQIYSAEYQKFIGMQIAMREVLEYFSKFELIQPQKSNADRIRCWNNHELAETIANFVSEIDNGDVKYSDDPNDWLEWLQKPAEES